MNAMNEIIGDLCCSLGLRFEITNSYMEVVGLLTRIRDQKTEVVVRFQDDTTCYTGVVTALSAKDRVLVIEDLAPEVMERSLKPGQTVNIFTSKNGDPVILNSKFIGPFVPRENLGYLFKIPLSLFPKLKIGA